MIKGSIHQKDIIIINIYKPNIRTPKNIEQTLIDLKGERDNNSLIIIMVQAQVFPVDFLSR